MEKKMGEHDEKERIVIRYGNTIITVKFDDFVPQPGLQGQAFLQSARRKEAQSKVTIAA